MNKHLLQFVSWFKGKFIFHLNAPSSVRCLALSKRDIDIDFPQDL